ncbi:MarR family transcriptional regulator [Streptomyces sp. NPDC006365]|uniref:MarR family transcriptional regulator n=1 Tax=Streptomyces sp. NPDC006365 TaxID=3364744 RepID=UPI0036792535
MTTTTPTVDGRVIGLAHYASRAALERILARTGNTFNQLVTLRLVAVGGDWVERDRLVEGVTGSLKIAESIVQDTIDELTTANLVEEAPAEKPRLRLTEAGQERYERIATATGEVAARIYAGVPAEDLATAGRVLTLITERANAELARA